jgi:mannan endo-1,4-beta-mannosidase
VGWQGDDDRSDVKSLTGAHACLHGFEVGGVGRAHNLDGVPFELLRKRFMEADARGQLLTVSWHTDNPLTGGDSWDTTPAVERILAGGPAERAFAVRVSQLIELFSTFVDRDGDAIPFVFRPFHEHNGDWFWWGRSGTEPEHYRELFRRTVRELRDALGDRLVIAHSPSSRGILQAGDLETGYPGDDVVDLLGVDCYWRDDTRELLGAVRALTEAARRHGKPCALTEVGPRDGLEGEPPLRPDFFTSLADELEALPEARELAYLCFWRNARAEHAFLPYPGHRLAADFVDFCKRSWVALGPTPSAPTRASIEP